MIAPQTAGIGLKVRFLGKAWCAMPQIHLFSEIAMIEKGLAIARNSPKNSEPPSCFPEGVYDPQ